MATDLRDGGENSMDIEMTNEVQSNDLQNDHEQNSKITKSSNKAKRPSGLEILAEAAMFSQKQDTENSTDSTKTSQKSQNQSNSPQKVQNQNSQKQDSNMPQAGIQIDTLDVIQNLVKNSSKNVAGLLAELNMTPDVFEYVLKQIQKREDEKRNQEEEKRAEIYKQLANLKNRGGEVESNNNYNGNQLVSGQNIVFAGDFQNNGFNFIQPQKPTSLLVNQPVIIQQPIQFSPVIQQINNPALAQLQAQQQLLLQLQQCNTTSTTVANFQARQQLTAALSTNSLGTNSNSSLSPMTGPNTASSSALHTPVQNQFIPVTPDGTGVSLMHRVNSSMDVVREEDETTNNFNFNQMGEQVQTIDDQVDEHFMKALGDKWKTLKQQTIGKFVRKSNSFDKNRRHSTNFNISPNSNFTTNLNFSQNPNLSPVYKARISPENVSNLSPNHLSPNHLSPNHHSLNRISPSHLTPNRNKPKRSTSFTTQTAPQRPTSLINNGNGSTSFLIPRKTTGGGSMKISKTGPACVNYTSSKNQSAMIGRLSAATTTPNDGKHMNQPVLSHLISVPYIIPTKQKRAINLITYQKQNPPE